MLALRILRRLGLSLAVGLFGILLPLALFVVPVSTVLQDKDHVSSWFEAGGSYDRFAPLISNQLASPERPDAETGLQPAELETVINQALPADVLAGYGQQLIDSVYSWLEGETLKPQFKIDLSERRVEIEASFRELLLSRLSSAPVCSEEQVGSEYDPLADNCLLPGQTPQSATDMAVSKLFGADGALSDLVLDSDKVFKETDMSDHPLVKLYDLTGPLRIALITAVVISGGLAVLLASHWRRGLKRVSWITLTTSLFTLAGTAVLTWLLPSLVERSMIDAGNEEINVTGLVIPVLTEALGDIGLRITLFTAPLALASIGVLIWLWRSGRSAEQASVETTPEPKVDEPKQKSTDQVQ